MSHDPIVFPKRLPLRERQQPGKNLLVSVFGLFFYESVRSLRVTASLFPSSNSLVSALLRSVDFARAQTIVEFGIGTGVVTSQILKRMRRDARLYAIEINPAFAEHIRERIVDPRLDVVLGGAEELHRILDARGVDRVDVIVSSLGLSAMSPRLRNQIMRQATARLRPGGVFSQFQYIHAAGEPNWMSRVGIQRFSEEQFLRQHFRKVSSERVMRNLPPAKVFTCHT